MHTHIIYLNEIPHIKNSYAKVKCIYLNLGIFPLIRHVCWGNIFHIQQNTVNPAPYSSEILIIWHLRRAIPRPDVFDFYKSILNETGWAREHVQKRPPRVSVHQPLWYLPTFCLLLQLLQLWRLQETHKRTLMTWISRWSRYPNGILLWLDSPSIGALTRNYL